MKTRLICSLLFICCIQQAFSQPNLVTNGSFEDTTLTDWCYRDCYILPYNDSAPGGGNWCLRVDNPPLYPGCNRNYAYQVFPNITNGEIYKLTGWAKVGVYDDYCYVTGWIDICRKVPDPPPYDYFLSIAWATVTSVQWNFFSVQDTFNLEPGDTAAIRCGANYMIDQPCMPNFILFDNIQLLRIDTTLKINEERIPRVYTYISNEGIHIYSDIEIEKITLTSIHGIKYYEKICRNNSHFINISYLNKGIYVLNVTDITNNITTKKITLL